MDTLPAYRQTLDYLYEKLPMFSRLGKAAIKPDLTNTLQLCAALGNPQQKIRCIHIAGTNGKGSTSHMMAAVLQDAGFKVGLYTSPHLVDFRERIRINGKPVSQAWVVDFVEKIKPLIDTIQPSFFEITVVMAFVAFAEEQVDFAIIETGLGGRLDSTNVITPVLSVITNISFDHKDLLGDTLPLIAKEKAGIIKQKVPVIIGERNPETERVFFETALHNQSPIYYADALWDLVLVKQDSNYQYYKAVNRARREIISLYTDLYGAYQQHNIKNVLTAIEVLNANLGIDITVASSLQAFSMVKTLTGLHGRWEVLQRQPLIITDVGHNAAGMKEVMGQWKYADAATKHIVVGFVKDKDISEALSFFPADNTYHFCNAALPRALPAEELKQMAGNMGLNGTAYNTVAAAVRGAKEQMANKDALLITGSFFVVGEAMKALEVE